MNIKSTIIILLNSSIMSLTCCSQERKPLFNDTDYIYSRKGTDDGHPYVITYLYRLDTNWSLKKKYFDSSYSILISKSFFYNGIPNGPSVGYAGRKITGQCFFVDGKYDGERLTFVDGKITQRAYFNKGIKTGTWIEYDKNQKIIRKTDYDKEGKLIQDVNY
jgi:antitoxin component YwqK of YwqJK toxin-antitoxin module